MLSTWPSVSSSSARPCGSQIVRSAPSSARNVASISTCVIVGLRLGCIRHWVVVTSVPSPSPVIEPPSNTMSIERTGSPRRSTKRSGSRSVVVVRQELVAPRVEAPVGRHPIAGLVDHVDRTRVAEPRVVDRLLDHLDAGPAHRRRPLDRPWRRQHRHRLEPGDRVRHLGVRRLGIGEQIRPTCRRAPASTSPCARATPTPPASRVTTRLPTTTLSDERGDRIRRFRSSQTAPHRQR